MAQNPVPALRAKVATLLAEADSIDLTALNDDQRARFDAIEAEVAKLNADITRAEARQEMQRTAPAVASYNGDGTPATPVAGSAGVRATNGHDRAIDKPWASIGEQLIAVAMASSPSDAFPGAGNVDPRLFKADASGMAVNNPGDGAVMIQKDFSLALMNRGMETAKLAPLCFPVPIGPNSDGIEMPYINDYDHSGGSVSGGVQVYRRAEADTVAATKPSIEMLDLRLQDMMGLAYMTDRLLQDAGALQAVLERQFSKQFAYRIDREIIRGTGAGQCLGILNASANSGPLITVAKETGQAAATVVNKNLSKMWNRLPAENRGNAVWLYNQDIEPQLDDLYISAGTGAIEPRFVSYGADGVLKIKGRPTMALEQCSTLGTLGDIFLVDLYEYLLISKGGLQSDQSIHVRFIYGERTFRWMLRNNGRPLWKTARTPENSAVTVSPYITLAARA